MMFHVVAHGRCWLEVDGAEPRWLEAGSMTLIPHGSGHQMRSDPEAPADPLFEIPVEQVSERHEIMRHGGGGAFTQVICVVLRFDHVAAGDLLPLLPRVLHNVRRRGDDGDWMRGTLRFISREAKDLRPGGETVIARLADILVIQTIRSWIESRSEASQGWLAALRDEHVGRAILSIYREPEKGWSVASLAHEAGMSRTAFSERFTHLAGKSAMRYVTEWRMRLARIHLRETSEPLSVIARRVGYDSEPAFCRAFKRVYGVPPGNVRRAEAASRV